MIEQRPDLDRALSAALTGQGRRWLADARVAVAADRRVLGLLFAEAGRACGRGPLPWTPGWTVDQAVRARLLVATGERGAELAGLLFELYRHGAAAERLAVLRALPVLAGELGGHGVAIVADALRTNDTRLIEAAVGAYAATWLDEEAYRQAVLKCVFVGVPLGAVAGLERRADRELARMLAGYAQERRVAGRRVPADIWPIVHRHPDVLAGDRQG